MHSFPVFLNAEINQYQFQYIYEIDFPIFFSERFHILKIKNNKQDVYLFSSKFRAILVLSTYKDSCSNKVTVFILHTIKDLYKEIIKSSILWRFI